MVSTAAEKSTKCDICRYPIAFIIWLFTIRTVSVELPLYGKKIIDSKIINPLDSKGNYSATSNNTKLVLWVGCYIWYSEEGPGRAAAPLSPLLALPNVTAHPSTASVPITVLLYDGPLLCGFNVAIKDLSLRR